MEKRSTFVVVFAAVSVLIASTTRARAGSSTRIELLRLEAQHPNQPVARGALHALVVHHPEGERLVKAECSVIDGFVVRRNHSRAGRLGRAVIGRLGYDILRRELPAELHPGLDLLGEAWLAGSRSEARKPRLKTRLQVSSDQLTRHPSYAVALVELRADGLTWIRCNRIVTELIGRGKRTKRRHSKALPMLLPAIDAPTLGREGLETLFLGTTERSSSRSLPRCPAGKRCD